MDGCQCQGCERHYRVDLLIPDELWDLVRPDGKPGGGGQLCGACMMTRIEALGQFRGRQIEALHVRVE